MLSIVETLRGFRNILLGQILRIYTDHKKLTCKLFNTYSMLRQRFILEQYGLDIEYIKGNKNIVSDATSILFVEGNQDTTQESTYKN